MAEGQCSATCTSLRQLHFIRDFVTLTLYHLCTWRSPKEKVNTRFPNRFMFDNPGLSVRFKSFSARVVIAMLEIKDNSNFIKGQGQADSNRGLSIEIKDGWQS